jgi:Tol biopolymer transport system component
MTEPTERALADWLRDGPERGPREGLEHALAATREVSQRPAWAIPERWLPMQLTMQRVPTLRPALLLATVALLILALLGAAILIGSQRRLPEPFGIARNGAIVFERGGDLFIADDLLGTERLLVEGSDRELAPSFSNQGDRIAFIREVDPDIQLMVVRPDGTDLRALGTFPSFDGFRWSPDGQALLINYTATDITGFRLAVVNADGSGFREVDLGRAVDWASWRPGGRHIAFRGGLGDGTSAAFVADADGSNVRRLPMETSSPTDFEGLGWSPDGAHLSFMSDGKLGGAAGGWQIGIADIDAAGDMTALRRIKVDPDSRDEMLPSWSPDSSRLAFIHEKDGVLQIAIARPDGTDFRLVGPTTVDRNGLGYAWSPDGRALLVASRADKVPLWSVDVASGDATPVEAPTDSIPSWQRLAP